MQRLRLLGARTAALPGEHRSSQTCPAGRVTGRGQATVPVHEKAPCHFREVQGEAGQYEQLVPEDMSPVRLAVQSPGGHSDIQLGGVRGQRLKNMEEMQAKDVPGFAGCLQLP